MGTRYSSTVTSDLAAYNSDPPPDDGSQTEANKTKWSTVKNKLGDPTKGALENLDTSIVEHFAEGPDTKSAAYTTSASDYNTVLEVSGSPTISLGDPTSVGAGYRTTVANAGSGTVTVDVDGGSTINGASSITLNPGESLEVIVNAAGTAYITKSQSYNEFAAGTKMGFFQDTAPTYWTIDATVDEHAVRLTKGSAAGGQAGGATGGNYNFSTQFDNLAKSGTPGIGDHVLSEAQLPTVQLGGSWLKSTASGSVAFTGGGQYGFDSLDAFGSGNGHSHTVDLRVKWASWIVCTKD